MSWGTKLRIGIDCVCKLLQCIYPRQRVKNNWEYKTELFWCLSVAEGTYVVVNSIAEDVWDSEDELTGALSDNIE